MKFYYTIRPLLPRRLQLSIRRRSVAAQLKRHAGRWPILQQAGGSPAGWQGWPDGKDFALVLTHDVESSIGVDQCERLASLEESYGLRSGFGFVPARYRRPRGLRERLAERGFEIFVHGYLHDGKLFSSKKVFNQRRVPINQYLREWGAHGFASPSAHHDFGCISALDIDYDISSYDYDPFEPQGGGVSRIFPFWVQNPGGPGGGFVELPYTLPQDFTLFVLMRNRSIDVWRRKLDWIVEKGGMALVKAHPDYMDFDGHGRFLDRYPVRLYTEFLDYVRSEYAGRYWNALPREVSDFWRSHPSPAAGKESKRNLALCTCASCAQLSDSGWFSDFAPSSR